MTHWNFFPLRPRRKRNGIGSLIEITRAQSLIFNAPAKSIFSSVSFNGSPKSTNARGCRRSASSSLTQRLFSLNYKHHEEDAQKNLRKHGCCFSQAHREAMMDLVALYRKRRACYYRVNQWAEKCLLNASIRQSVERERERHVDSDKRKKTEILSTCVNPLLTYSFWRDAMCSPMQVRTMGKNVNHRSDKDQLSVGECSLNARVRETWISIKNFLCFLVPGRPD